MHFPFQHSFPLKLHQYLSFLRVFHDKMTFTVASVILEIEDYIDDSGCLLGVGFVDGFWGGFEWHVREVYPEGFVFRVCR